MRKLLKALVRPLLPRRVRPFILMYHRIAASNVDPWGLSVRPEFFNDQMQMLATERTPLSMDDFVNRLAAGTLPNDAVAVTFDDGYLDNLENARPILMRYCIPATVFIATGKTGTTTRFWWDEIAELLLRREPAIDATMDLGGKPFRIAFPAIEADVGHSVTWSAERPAVSQRQRAYMAIWRHMRSLDHQSCAASVSCLRTILGDTPAESLDRAMTADEIARLTAGGLVTIGAHTMSHPALSELDPSQQQREISGSLRACAALTSAPVVGFAYPYGDHDLTTKQLVKAAGARWACSTHETAVNTLYFDPHDLPRIRVQNWSGAQLDHILRL